MTDLIDVMVEVALIEANGIPTPVRCSNCDRYVVAVPQDLGWARVGYVIPVDSEGHCPDCAWMA
jgi:hypothetical protein